MVEDTGENLEAEACTSDSSPEATWVSVAAGWSGLAV